MRENEQSGSDGNDVGRTWKVTLAYDGTDYHGWQVQPGLVTVQGELQAALGRVTGEAPLPQGSGRTDAGVHALGQVASFMLQAGIPEENLMRALNRTLPAAIRVLEARMVEDGFHARHSTVAKTYEYRVFVERSESSRDQRAEGQGPRDRGTKGQRGERRVCPPFLARYLYAYPWPLELGELQRAAELFVGTHDFLSFAATDPDEAARCGEAARRGEGVCDEEGEAASAVRTIFGSWWEPREIEEGTLLVYRVRGDGFLHHMVRTLVGTMLDVGRGYRRPEEIPGMLAARARAAAGPTAPARGLFLHSVEY